MRAVKLQLRREEAGPMAMLGFLRDDGQGRRSRASTPKWEIEDSSFELAMPLWHLAAARLKG